MDSHLVNSQTLTAIVLNTCFVHPDHRRRGIGSLLIEWGIKKAVELGLEIFVEAVELGVPFYLKHGFHILHHFWVDPQVINPNDEWRRWKQKFPPLHGVFMRRPAELAENNVSTLCWNKYNLIERNGYCH